MYNNTTTPCPFVNHQSEECLRGYILYCIHIHSVITLFGRPVSQLVDANIKSASHMAAPKCIKACECGQDVQLLFRTNVRMGKKCDFHRGMIVDARQGRWSISETADVPVSSSSTCRNVLLMREVRGEGPQSIHTVQQWYAEEQL